jgi:hypothetical protein
VLGDFVTFSNFLTLNGITPSGGTPLSLFISGVANSTTTSQPNGTWQLTNIMDEGTYQFKARVHGAFADSPYSATFTVTIDNTAPTVAMSEISTDTGASSTDGITQDQTLFILGTAEAKASIEVFKNSVSIGKTTTGTDGKWTYDYTGTTGRWHLFVHSQGYGRCW